METEHNPSILVRMLGRFEFSDGQRTLTQAEIHSDRVTKLAAYLILHSRRGCSFRELIDELWANDLSDNPVNALKNLMYRLRKILARIWPDTSFFLTVRGQYQWNPAIPLTTDVREFESRFQAAKDCPDGIEKRLRLVQAGEVYRGKFLEDLSGEYWILNAQTLYQRMFMEGAKMLARELEAEGDYAMLERMCMDVIARDPYDEEMHSYLLRSYMEQGMPVVADRHYWAMTRMMLENLGMEPSESLRKIHDEIMLRQNRRENDLDTIERALLVERGGGACHCTFSEFRKIYELEARRQGRLESNIVLGRITLEEQDEKRNRIEESPLRMVMLELEDILIHALRAEDVVARYSDCEFLVLLMDCSLKDTDRVIERIHFRTSMNTKRWKNVRISYSLKEMERGETCQSAYDRM